MDYAEHVEYHLGQESGDQSNRDRLASQLRARMDSTLLGDATVESYGAVLGHYDLSLLVQMVALYVAGAETGAAHLGGLGEG